MKPIFTLLLLSFFFIKSNAQSGIEVISDSYNYFYTSINEQDSTVLTLVNLVNADQIVTFEDDELPFSLSNQQIIIPALDTGQITVYFNPTQTGLFMLNLSYTGSLFGSGVIFFEGEGTLVELTLSSDTLVLPQVSLGESSSSSFTISNTGTGTMSYSINSTSELISLSSTSGTITSEGSDLIDLTYTPVNSGEIMFNINIIGNDPNNPTTIFTVVGSAVSEKEGNICNESWTPINNPYVFTGNVRIASDCQLSIEPGTVVDMNGYQMLIEGSLNANGTEADSLYFENGNFIFRNNEPQSLEYWSVDFPLQSAYTFYHNDFNSNDDIDDSEFACYGYNQNFNIENFDDLNYNTSNSYGCDTYEVYNTSSYYPYVTNSSNLTTPSYHLRWQAYNSYSYYDGVLVTKDFIIEDPGSYRVMYNYRVVQNYRYSSSNNEQFLKSYYRINSEDWILFNESPPNLYYNDYTEFPISDLINLNVNDTLKIVIVNDNEYYSESTEYRIDDFKIEKVSGEDLQVFFEGFEDSVKFENGEWTTDNNSFENECITISSNYKVSGSNAMKFTNTESGSQTLKIGSISVPTSGNYYIEYYMKNIYSSYAHRQYFQWGYNDDFQSYYFYKHDPHQYNSYNSPSYDWQKRTAWLGFFNAGDVINLQFRNSSNYTFNQSSSYKIEFYIDDLRIFNRSESSPSLIAQGSDISIANSRIDLKVAQLGNDLGIDVVNSTIRSLNTVGNNSPINLYNSTVTGSTGDGIKTSGENSPISLTYSFVKNSISNGIESIGQNSDINLNSSLISHNSGYGLKSNSKINTNYSNITFNDNDGIYLLGNSFSNIKNSIIWGNDIENYNQINTQSGVTSITYSSVQGLGAYGTEGSQYYFGDGAIDDDPVFTDQLNQHLSTFSNCVDAGTPWENDNHMPFGLGGVRADIGIYGGPDNWFWGGEPIPDGSPIITAISDSPQDQGGIVGVLFDKSVWDDNDLENKVTSYSIWRNFDAEGNSIDTISDGNWQLMGYMPAQAFDAYAYEAPTLGDSSLAEGSFNSCFVILAHTQDSSVYWYSDVMCGYSTDDISPNTTEVFAELVNEEEVMISWNPPTDEDYSYSEVISSSGFNTSNITDTLTYDISFESGDLITYGVIHYDVNGNPSDTSFVSIQIEDQKDYIPLYQGWNLISTRLTPNENNMPAIFSSLEPNNLIYATGFNNGVSVYDPNGLPFLNTLSQFDDGYGYWVKVNEDDTLVINGNPISHDFIPPYNAGWNLMGYTEGVTQSISSYFDFLLNENNLIYVTNFNQGAAFYDPNGLPFLNSLNYVEDNLGYWVKTSSPFGGIAYRLSHDSQEYSPNFMLINGESNLSEYIGNKVQVYNQLMEKIAELEIIEGGYLMTNAIYGDDPATEVIEGMENGELLSFGFMNHIIEDKIEFNADMNLRKVNLNFEVSDVISIYPNPLRDLINIRINEADDCELDIQIFDIAGRLVYSDLNRAYFKGSDKVSVDFSEFENGAYYLKLFIDNELRFNESIIKQ